MAEVKWIKITTGMFEDEKIDFIESLPEADAILVIWIKLLSQAGKNNMNGFIFLTEKIPYTEEMLSHKFRRPLSTVRLALRTLEELEMIIFDDTGFIKIANWEKHQNIEGLDKIREQTRKRVAKHRENQRLLQGNVTVTLGNAIEQEQDLELEQEQELDKQQHRENKIIEDVVVVLDNKIDVQEAKKIIKAANGDINLIKVKYEIAKVSEYNNLVGFMIQAIKENWQMKEKKDKPKNKVNTKFHNFDQRSDKYSNDDLEKIVERKKGERQLKNFKMANRGQAFEEEVELSNNQYRRKGIASIQKIATPVKVLSNKAGRVSGFYEKKSTLDFRGTVKPGISISFDCKENNKDERGLPLSYIQDHQIQYMRQALEVEEETFILCYMAMLDKRYFIPGKVVIFFWDIWQQNKGKRGYNYVPLDVMKEVKSRNGIILDYLGGMDNE